MDFLYYAKSNGFTKSNFMHKLKFGKKIFVFFTCYFLINSTFAQRFTPNSYIDEHSDLAQQLMNETGVPASVILAIAIHESAYGNSKIAKHLHNHFGIKGKNNSKKIRSAYKGYPSVLQSYHDFVGLLKRRKATQELFDKHASDDYKSWVAGIARAGYSETRSWSKKVLTTISRYELDRYDAAKKPHVSLKKIPFPPLPEVSQQDIILALNPLNYTVQMGDTLSRIAQKTGCSVSEIQNLNDLGGSLIVIGQRLII